MNERPKSPVDMIEELGAGVDAGLLGREEAVQRLQQLSDGRMTRLGAEDLLGQWQSARATYRSMSQLVENGLVGSLMQRGERDLLDALTEAARPHLDISKAPRREPKASGHEQDLPGHEAGLDGPADSGPALGA